MNTQTSIRKLQLITAFDSLSYGLIYGFISPYVIQLGGNHVTVGILSMGNLLGDLLSSEVIKIFTHIHGRRFSLFFILNTAMITHFMMVLTPSYWFTILVRILFSITNQSQNLCLELLLNKAESDEARKRLQRNYSILSGTGYILGPIISGYIFDRGFGYIGILAALLTFINSLLLVNIPKDPNDKTPEHTDKSVLEKAVDKVSENIENLKKSKFQKHWDILVLKYLFASSIMIFFSKFTQILKHNYQAGSITIGYTSSYINILVFAATYYVVVFQSNTEQYPVVFLSELSFFFLALFMVLNCYAPYYTLYMLLLIPIIFLRTYILSTWSELFEERKNENLNKLNNSASVVAGLTIPLFFGLTCNRIAHQAVILFSCVPVSLCWVIVRFYSRFVQIDDSEKDKDS